MNLCYNQLMADWFLKRVGADYTSICERHHIPYVLARLMRNRDIKTDEEIEQYLHGGRECLHAPGLLKDMSRCASFLCTAIRDGKKIRVIGDYDIDGVCSTAILVRGLRRLGADVDSVIPHRIRDGYGMNTGMIRAAAGDGIDLILTCDNGIAAAQEAELAKELGIQLLVTDHHEIPFALDENGEKQYKLPLADAIVDPKQEDCLYPFPGICGGMIAYKLILYLFENCTDIDYPQRFDEELLQLAAFATVGDIMELRDENRVLVKLGLQLMKDRPAPGIRELIEVLGLAGKEINAFHLGFLLGPCINAAGRIDSADRALKLLLTEDRTEAEQIAAELKLLNEERKEMTEQGCRQAKEQIEAGQHDGCDVYVIYLPDCHESIAGIVAGRIREQYCHPTLIVTRAEDGLKGSARSIEAYHMYNALNEVADIFSRFGGHAQAAGFSLPEDRLEELRRRLNENSRLTEADFKGKLLIDLELPLRLANGDLIEQLRLLEPCGNGNAKAVIGRQGLRLRKIRPVGAEEKLCIINVEDEGCSYEMKMFFKTDLIRDYIAGRYGDAVLNDLLRGAGEGVPFSVVYQTQWNDYQGERTLQLVVEDFK